MTFTIDLPAEVASQIARLAAHDGQDVEAYLRSLVEHEAATAARALDSEDASTSMEARIEEAIRRPVPQTLDEIHPRNAPPPGKTAMQMIHGQWPGDETTEQLLAQLAELG